MRYTWNGQAMYYTIHLASHPTLFRWAALVVAVSLVPSSSAVSVP